MLKSYHYTECGLDNIYLFNGYKIEKDGSLFIQDIHGLHHCIGESLIILTRKLKPKEIRFMRHFMDLSQKAYGNMLGVDYQTVLRWETGKNVIPKTADRLLRILFQEFLDPTSNARELINMLSDIDNDRDTDRVQLIHKRVWQTAA